jgi:hypothetical protein
MKEISSLDFPQHGEVFYFYGQALKKEAVVEVGEVVTCIEVNENQVLKKQKR